MKIALVADTHVPEKLAALPPEFLRFLAGVDLALHAGDLTCLDVLAIMQSIVDTVAVHGNLDDRDVVRQLPDKRLITAVGRRIGLIHGNQPPEIEVRYARPEYDFDSPQVEPLFTYLSEALPTADIIVFGHIHSPLIKRRVSQLFINPGSLAPSRGRQTCALLNLTRAQTDATIIDF